MHIKKLEIAGFKSFVDRTVIHFDHDVVGIVGPNGCGKSNTVDAIRWCMGEQSAKHLRGRAMEDVIFAGSESRGPHSFAEVTLTFDNTDPIAAAQLPVEYGAFSEIAVTRRLFRDGKSEYLLNKTQVRLRDVTDLFLGTGVGTKAYSIVEQGRIGQIVTARPQDRRMLLEEAAGITKYKARRKQAERKMDLTRQNLVRVTDILGELERSCESLKRQAQKADRFLRYRSELEDRVLHDSAHRYLETVVVRNYERGALAKAGGESTELHTTLSESESKLDTARAEAQTVETRTDECSKQDFDAQNKVGEIQGELSRSSDRLTHLRERLSSVEAERLEIEERLTHMRHERGDLETRIQELGEEERGRAAEAGHEEEALEELRGEHSEATAAQRELEKRGSEIKAQIAAADARILAGAEKVGELRKRRQRIIDESETLQGDITALEAKKHALDANLVEVANGRQLSVEERDALATEVKTLAPQVEELHHAHEELKSELGQKRNRLSALEDLHRRLVGVGAGARALLSSDDPSVLGLVADRIEAPEKLTGALAGLLGDWLQCVVVADPDEGLELLADLRDKKRGRATIVPAHPPYVAGRTSLPRDAEHLGYLADQLIYIPEDEGLVHALVGDAVLTETADQALALVRRHPSMVAISLDGTVARENGLVCGGTGDDVAAGMIEQKREMHLLTDEVAILETRTHGAAEAFNNLRARRTELKTRLEQARQGAHEGELAFVTAEKDVHRNQAELERAITRRENLGRDTDELAKQIEAAREKLDTDQNGLGDSRSEIEDVLNRLESAVALVLSWSEQVNAQTSRVMERKVVLAQIKEQLDAACATSERLEGEIGDLDERLDRLDNDAVETTKNYGETAGRLMLFTEQREAAAAHATETAGAHNEARELLTKVREALASEEALLKELREQVQSTDETVRAHEMKLQRLELEEEHLLQNVRERFRGVDLRRIIGDYHARPAPDEEHRARIDELTRLIERMGSVNLEAESEFAEKNERFTHLSEQREDIDAALKDLEKAIHEMDKESKRRFRETFTAVNELFSKTFRTLFRGGHGELRLTDPSDMLETGVEILAQPPGKKLGNIELMSGGEKALTAAALIFAMFQHRPSPFCILDEVDAPLDEANVARYNEIIRTMTEHSQFIVITHSRATMQAVDVLYGVTMGEPGVSRIVSVRVNEGAEARSERAVADGDTMPAPAAPAAPADAADAAGSGAEQVA